MRKYIGQEGKALVYVCINSDAGKDMAKRLESLDGSEHRNLELRVRKSVCKARCDACPSIDVVLPDNRVAKLNGEGFEKYIENGVLGFGQNPKGMIKYVIDVYNKIKNSEALNFSSKNGRLKKAFSDKGI
jgi:hypothetical protein